MIRAFDHLVQECTVLKHQSTTYSKSVLYPTPTERPQDMLLLPFASIHLFHIGNQSDVTQKTTLQGPC